MFGHNYGIPRVIRFAGCGRLTGRYKPVEGVYEGSEVVTRHGKGHAPGDPLDFDYGKVIAGSPTNTYVCGAVTPLVATLDH